MEKNQEMVITIDGPAGGGKSSAARLLAKRLDFEFLDTGAMYRSVALAGIRAGIDWSKPEELVRLAERAQIDNRDGRTYLNGEDVSEAVRTPEVTAKTRFAADHPDIRRILVARQRASASGRALVTEGRDQGSVVFPDALVKFYLTAGPEERARRRIKEWEAKGDRLDPDEVLRQIVERDRRDSSRAVGPLTVPDGAVTVDSDGKTLDQVVEEMATEVESRLSRGKAPEKKD